MARLKGAGQGEILRAAEKDENYLASLHQRLSSLCLEVVGPQVWLRYRWLAEPVARCLYLSLTTLSDLQTLGEEYTGLIQLSPNQARLPSKCRRLVMILLQTLGPHLLKYLLRNIENIVTNQPNIREDARKQLLRAISYGETVLDFLSRINLALFYFNGTFYHLSKRMTGISYVNYSAASQGEDSTSHTFRLMGILASVHLGLNLLYGLYKARRVLLQTEDNQDYGVTSNTGSSDSYVRADERCSLCLERLGSNGVTTATPCGHLFCWTCLLESLARQQVSQIFFRYIFYKAFPPI